MKNSSSKNKNLSRAGFTLVEVIVVLVVLAILAAIMIPAMTGWIDEANRKRCVVQIGDVRRDYGALAAYNAYEVDAAQVPDLLSEAVLEMIGQTAAGTRFPDGMGGTCVAEVSADNNAIIDINCNLHGGLTGLGLSAYRTQNAEAGLGLLTQNAAVLDKISKFFRNDSSNGENSLDSTGKKNGAEVQDALKPLLASLGIPEDVSWKVDYDYNKPAGTGTMNIYWTDRDIATIPAEQIASTRIPYVMQSYSFDLNTNQFTQTGAAPQSGTMGLSQKTYYAPNSPTKTETIVIMDARTSSVRTDTEYGASLAN